MRSIVRHTGGTPYQIDGTCPRNAFVIDRPPLRLLYVRPLYSGYRRVALKVFPKTNWRVDFDHVLGRKMAQQLGFSYVLLIRIPPSANRSHGRYERAEPLVGFNLHKLCFADRRILDKWIGRGPNLWRDPLRLHPYRLGANEAGGLTLKQRGRWGFALGVEDDPLPLGPLTLLELR